MSTILILIGSAIGGAARYWASVTAGRLWGDAFPWGTLIVNVLGSLIIGFASAFADPAGRFPLHPNALLFTMVGFCGGFTTFSSFSLQTLVLLRSGAWPAASLNILGSVALCLLTVWIGYALASAINTPR